MDFLHAILLVAGGFVGGTLSAVVGGAAVFTFPALLAAGLAPINAAACNMAAMVPCNFIAAIADHGQLPRFDRGFITLLAASVAGACVGAILLLFTPERVFEVLVPLLLGFATVLFGLSPRIGAWLRARADDVVARDPKATQHSVGALVPVSVYGGYFGAGVGVLLLAVMSVGTRGDYRSANVAKNLVTSLNSVVAAALFIWHGLVVWPQTLTMMAGAFAGGLLGSWLARSLPRELMRVVIVIVGALLTVLFARRYWF